LDAGETRGEKYLAVALQLPRKTLQETETSLAELKRLAGSASGEVADATIIKVRQVDPAFFVSRGKATELRACAEALDLTGIIFDEDFSPVQTRNLTDETGVRIIGRTELILDIFARRAQTHEGKLQVELAQLQFLMPRLIGKGFVLSRLGGGIGTRGPGETKLETDRRRIGSRITQLRRELVAIRRQRETRRKRRLRREILTVALIGYTNAGKSTLLRALTQADVHIEDRLFATLDPSARKAILPDGRAAVFTDTVGFIHRLPASLVAAFKATLEEILYADLLLHVVDASSPTLEREVRTTVGILEELGADKKPVLQVFNKIDQGLGGEAARSLEHGNHESVAISALYGIGIHDLLAAVAGATSRRRERLTLRIPYSRFDLLARVHATSSVAAVAYSDDCIEIETDVDDHFAAELRQYATEQPAREPWEDGSQ
jgi:GTP-binding protein HflX